MSRIDPARQNRPTLEITDETSMEDLYELTNLMVAVSDLTNAAIPKFGTRSGADRFLDGFQDIAMVTALQIASAVHERVGVDETSEQFRNWIIATMRLRTATGQVQVIGDGAPDWLSEREGGAS